MWQTHSETRETLSAVVMTVVLVISAFAGFAGFLGGAVAAGGNTATASVTLDDNGIKKSTNHHWTVDFGAVDQDVTNIKLDYSGTGTTFSHMPKSAVTVTVNGTPSGTVMAAVPENNNHRLNILFDSSDELSLEGKERIQVQMSGNFVKNPPTGGTHSPTIRLYNGSKFASASASFSMTGGTVEGSVTNATDGTTVSGATVAIVDGFTTVDTATTDGSGSYSVDVPPGTYDVTIDASGYAAKTAKDKQVTDGGTTTVDAGLEIAGVLTGSVSNVSNGNPVDGATVMFEKSQPRYFTDNTTKSSGVYRAEVVPGTYEVTVRASGYGSELGTITVGAKETKSTDFSLRPATSSISGTITDDTSSPISFTRVTAMNTTTNLQTAWARTDGSGTYTLNVPSGDYKIETSPSGYASGTRTLSVGSGKSITGKDFSLAQAGTVQGTVTDVDGNGIGSIDVIAYEPKTRSTAGFTQTNANGQYSFGVGPGTYDIITYDRSGTYEDEYEFDVTVTSGGTVRTDLSMTKAPPRGTLTGTVVGPDGTAVSGATVEAIDTSHTHFKRVKTDGSGQFTMSVPESTYEITANASGYSQGIQADVTVTGDSKTSTRISLSQPAYVEGTVTNTSGVVSNAMVLADSGERTMFTRTDANGDFNITVSPGSTYQVLVFARNQSAPAQAASPTVGNTVTADFSLQSTTIKHSSVEVLDPEGVKTDDIGLSADVQQGMLMVRLLNNSSPTTGTPEELRGLGVDADTEFRINLTVENYDPTTLLWGARNVSWETARNDSAPSATDITVRTSAVDLQGVSPVGLPAGKSTYIGPLMQKSPSDINWPTGHNDRADRGWNKTVYFGLFDMGTAPSDVRQRFGGMTVTTNAQTFAPPRVVDDTLKVWVAGPHRTIDGNTHSGFYEATIPDSQLQDWDIDPANAASELQVMYQGKSQNFQVTDLADGVRIHLDIHYSAGTVAVSPKTGAGSGSSGSSGTSQLQTSVSVSSGDGATTAILDSVVQDDPVVIATDGLAAGGVTVSETTVTFDMGTTADNDVSLTTDTARPATVSAPGDVSVLSYLTVDVSGNLEGRETGGSFTFTVSEDRLADLKATAEDVQAYHYDEAVGEWEKIPTRQLSDGSFEATTDSFSTFAIGTTGIPAQQSTPTPTPTRSPESSPTLTETDSSGADATPTATETPGGSGPGFGVFATLVALLAIVALVRRRGR